MNFTYYGHSCFNIKIDKTNILFDPYITPNPLAKNIKIKEILADYILVSHGHSDHIADCVEITKNTSAQVISSFEVVEWLQKKGIKNTHPLNTGGKIDLDFGRVKCVNAIHSSQMPDGSYGANPMGFLITSKEKNFYYSGDTALTMDMQLIPRWVKLDFAILCIGDNFTMGYEDAIEAAKMVECTTVIGVHYDTFGLIKIDHERAVKAFNDAGMELLLPAIGDTIEL
jgi:L-ascorbate metabolism protein UlaG (beta-lactamase superfamily)